MTINRMLKERDVDVSGGEREQKETQKVKGKRKRRDDHRAGEVRGPVSEG